MKTWICAFFLLFLTTSIASAADMCGAPAITINVSESNQEGGGNENAFLKSGAESIVALVCKIHKAAYKAVETMESAANSSKGQGDMASTLRGLTVTLFGYVTMLIIAYGMIVLTFQVIEVVVRLGVYGAFAPLFIYAYIYPSTRPIFDTAVKGFIYTFFKFALIGLFGGVSLVIIKIAMESAGGFTSTITSGSMDASSIAQAIAYAAAAIASALMISRLMGAASSIAAAITQYSYANIGVAAGGASGISTMNRVTMMTALPVVGIAGGAITGGAARGLISGFMSMSKAQQGSFLLGAVAAIGKKSFMTGGVDNGVAELNGLMEATKKGGAGTPGTDSLPTAQQSTPDTQKAQSYN